MLKLGTEPEAVRTLLPGQVVEKGEASQISTLGGIRCVARREVAGAHQCEVWKPQADAARAILGPREQVPVLPVREVESEVVDQCRAHDAGNAEDRLVAEVDVAQPVRREWRA